MKIFSVKGILLGLLATIAMDTVMGICLIPLFAKSTSPEALEALSHETGPLIFSMVFGAISTVLGGFIAAKFSKSAPYKNAAVIGVIGVILGVLLSGHYPLWFNIVAFIVTIPSALLGAHFVAIKRA